MKEEELLTHLQHFYNENKEMTSKTYPYTYYCKKLFGSWNNALEVAGIPITVGKSFITNCKNCNKEVKTNPSVLRKSKNGSVFCGSKCAAIFNNTNRTHDEETKQKISHSVKKYHDSIPKPLKEHQPKPEPKPKPIYTSNCKFCGQLMILKKSIVDKRVYCSIPCSMAARKQQSVDRFLEGKICRNETIRNIFKEIGKYICSSCGINEWQNKPISLEVDHIDGDSSNNYPDNIRLLCPNCHSQTPTYKFRNYGNPKGKEHRRKRYEKNLKLVG